MLTPSFEQKLTTYTDIYSQLKTAFKWKMSDDDRFHVCDQRKTV
ncbi:hypothetical protein [Fictibacillus sp. NRS-1165]